MSLIEELIGGEWSEKAAKLLSRDTSFSNLATIQHFESEYFDLMSYLEIKYGWDWEDEMAWRDDLQREPKNTIDVLRALKASWGRGDYGVLTNE